MDQPTIQHRDPQAYAAIVRRVAMQDIGPTLPPLIGQVAAWLGAHGAAPTGAPFFRYLVIDGNEMEIEVGFPTASELPGADGVVTGTLPGGSHAIVSHVGHPRELYDVTGRLLDWGKENGVRWDMALRGNAEHWASRLEIYLTDPAVEPDPAKWTTVLAFKLAES